MKEPKLQTLKFKKIPYKGKSPQIESIFIAPNCFLIGDVILKEGTSIWFGTTCRGDTSTCEVGEGSAVHKHCFVESSIIGTNTLLSHGVIAHKCQIGNNVIVGIGARVIDGAKIGDNTLIGAGALILPNTQIPPNSIVVDKGKIIRKTQEEDLVYIRESVHKVKEKAKILNDALRQRTS